MLLMENILYHLTSWQSCDLHELWRDFIKAKAFVSRRGSSSCLGFSLKTRTWKCATQDSCADCLKTSLGMIAWTLSFCSLENTDVQEKKQQLLQPTGRRTEVWRDSKSRKRSRGAEAKEDLLLSLTTLNPDP